jgi:hypothetical protein
MSSSVSPVSSPVSSAGSDQDSIFRLQSIMIQNKFEKFKEIIESGSFDINKKFEEIGPVNVEEN